ncbi:hypothetical protein JKP88DRAFT_224189, partial [Tribonema minus]
MTRRRFTPAFGFRGQGCTALHASLRLAGRRGARWGRVPHSAELTRGARGCSERAPPAHERGYDVQQRSAHGRTLLQHQHSAELCSQGCAAVRHLPSQVTSWALRAAKAAALACWSHCGGCGGAVISKTLKADAQKMPHHCAEPWHKRHVTAVPTRCYADAVLRERTGYASSPDTRSSSVTSMQGQCITALAGRSSICVTDDWPIHPLAYVRMALSLS